MRDELFEALRPVCPLCADGDSEGEPGGRLPLEIGWVARRGARGELLDGALQCPAPACRAEFPVVDGLPLLVPDVRGFVEGNHAALTRRDDLSPEIDAALAECCGAGSAPDLDRQHLSFYAWDHWGERDAGPGAREARAAPPGVEPGSLSRAIAPMLDAAADGLPDGPVLDLGCSVGRATFDAAARLGRPALGVDASVPMLRLARGIAATGRVRYARRRSGLLYEARDFAADLPAGAQVDFWAADALRPPFAPGTFAAVLALNVLDCVESPLALLRAARELLRPGGALLLVSPFDWSSAATEPGSWIGGRGERTPQRGDSAATLRDLLEPGKLPVSLDGLTLERTWDPLEWNVRTHERAATRYAAWGMLARATAGRSGSARRTS